MTTWMSERGCVHADFMRGMVCGSCLKEREMGPIERELRTAVPGQAAWINNRLWPVLEGSAKTLGVDREWLSTVDLDADVLSEAIEAAEALGL